LPENIQMLVHNFSRCFFTFSTGVFLILLLMSTHPFPTNGVETYG